MYVKNVVIHSKIKKRPRTAIRSQNEKSQSLANFKYNRIGFFLYGFFVFNYNINKRILQ